MPITRTLTAAALAAGLLAAPAMAGTLVFNTDTSDPQPKAAFEAVVKQFEAENPGVTVKMNIYDHESYKSSIRNWLTSAPPDVALWYSGARMRQFVTPGLLEDVSALFTPEARGQFAPKVLDTVTVEGKQFGVPYSYYQWGIFARTDLLQKAGVGEIKTWDDLLGACDKLRAAGVEPVDLGSKDLWPTAGWFDYIDLRLNGYEFHTQLTEGRVSWQDPKVRDVFAHWKQLLDHQCFIKNHTSLSWQESQSLMYQGKAGMMLIGNFITQGMPADAAANMGFLTFPIITPGVAEAEEAPIESINIPAGAKNKPDAMKLLAFMMRADVQTTVNKTLRQLPTNTKATVSDDRFLKAGAAQLDRAAHLTQFLDRDTSEDLATVAMKGFQEFMVKPERLDAVLATIERARKRIYASN